MTVVKQLQIANLVYIVYINLMKPFNETDYSTKNGESNESSVQKIEHVARILGQQLLI